MKMTKEEFAEKLNGLEYPTVFEANIEADAKESGLVVVYGMSDDLMEMRGAINDEGDCFQGDTFTINKDGIMQDFRHYDGSREEVLEKYFLAKNSPKAAIKAVWDEDGIPWQIRTDLPHATFDIMEDGELYCKGIVFNIDDIHGAGYPTAVTQERIDALFAAATFEDAKMGKKTTVVVMTLPNGFELVESSACVSPDNYDHAVGVEICKRQLKNAIWAYEGYLLQSQHARGNSYLCPSDEYHD